MIASYIANILREERYSKLHTSLWDNLYQKSEEIYLTLQALEEAQYTLNRLHDLAQSTQLSGATSEQTMLTYEINKLLEHDFFVGHNRSSVNDQWLTGEEKRIIAQYALQSAIKPMGNLREDMRKKQSTIYKTIYLNIIKLLYN